MAPQIPQNFFRGLKMLVSVTFDPNKLADVDDAILHLQDLRDKLTPTGEERPIKDVLSLSSGG